VVCKQCGSQVSPYITECPYCGHRLRRRAPKLPRDGAPPRHRRARVPATLGRLRPGEIPGVRADAPPYATAALVILTCGVWIAWRGAFVDFGKLVITGPLHGDWWRLFTAQFAYASGLYQFVTLVAVAIFGWLLERRHGPLIVVFLFVAAGVSGALVELALHSSPLMSGGAGAALALLCAWALPDLRAARGRRFYDGDLLGVAAIAAVLLAMPLARTEASWPAVIVGAVVGLVLGAGLDRVHPR
jgi:membrane associated rhomboid family serine protease